MKAPEINQFVEIDHPITYVGTSTQIKLKNGIVLNGYFERFDDFYSLKEENKWRFLEFQNAQAFKDDMNASGKANPKFSTLLNGEEIESISLVKTA
jgi:small nuclear ribonucleoprotein (snRNP)-like protein